MSREWVEGKPEQRIDEGVIERQQRRLARVERVLRHALLDALLDLLEVQDEYVQSGGQVADVHERQRHERDSFTAGEQDELEVLWHRAQDHAEDEYEHHSLRAVRWSLR